MSSNDRMNEKNKVWFIKFALWIFLTTFKNWKRGNESKFLKTWILKYGNVFEKPTNLKIGHAKPHTKVKLSNKPKND